MTDPLKTAVGRSPIRKPDLGYSRYLPCMMMDLLKMADPLKTAVGRNPKRKPDLGYSHYLLCMMMDLLKMADPLKTAVDTNPIRKPDLGYNRYLLCMMVNLLKLSDKSPSHKIQLVDNQSVKNKISCNYHFDTADLICSRYLMSTVVGMKLKESILK